MPRNNIFKKQRGPQKKASGHAVFPTSAMAASVSLRRSISDPRIRQAAEDHMVLLLAPLGAKGLEDTALFRKVDKHLISQNARFTLSSFATIRSDGPFNHKVRYCFEVRS